MKNPSSASCQDLKKAQRQQRRQWFPGMQLKRCLMSSPTTPGGFLVCLNWTQGRIVGKDQDEGVVERTCCFKIGNQPTGFLIHPVDKSRVTGQAEIEGGRLDFRAVSTDLRAPEIIC